MLDKESLDHYYAVIMAGGGGTRLWPLSRQSRPKQMLKLFGESTLFQVSVDRLRGLFSPDRIYVVTVAEQAQELMLQSPQIPVENFLIEPMPRGTASVVGLAAVALFHRDPLATMAVVTADHYIGNLPLFHQLLCAAYEIAHDDYLVTLGITPTFPATGFGYIQRAGYLKTCQDLNIFQVEKFKEKPDIEHARIMIQDGEHSWNSGMFVWRASTILNEFSRQMPELSASLAMIAQAWGTVKQGAVVESIWPDLRAETIDYGIMEGANRVAVIPAAGLEWSDVGSWDSLFDLLERDPNGNILMAEQHLELDTTNSLLYTSQASRLIVTIGVDDLIVADTGDVVLVCKRDQAQRVRQVVNHFKQNGPEFI